jgi:aminopeptidase YwaD
LSTDAHERLKAALVAGDVQLHVVTDVAWTTDAKERTVVADIRGSEYPDERFVFSAHLQEPGANDNASGVGAQVEVARVAAALVTGGEVDPKRTITFLWGDEITSTNRYVTQNDERAQGIRWGLSLDMVGEDTAKTGGTFLIEKMPDPSAIWTRGEDKHSEWGGDPMTKADMRPHYFNDLVLGRALEQAATNGWVVKTNPFEGGSDHVPFLQADIPGLLFWHFTDQFYHTDRDRLEMVSADELKNVGVTALVTAIAMTSADGALARSLIVEVRNAALVRLEAETDLSVAAIKDGKAVADERDIVTTWANWYDDALATMVDIEVGGSSAATESTIETARKGVSQVLADSLDELGE